VRVLSYSGSGIETTFTQGEDACLAALVPFMPKEAPHAPHSLLVVGALADVVEDQFMRLFDVLGVAPVTFLPMRQASDLPQSAPTRRFFLPNLSSATPLARSRSGEPSESARISHWAPKARLYGSAQPRTLLASTRPASRPRRRRAAPAPRRRSTTTEARWRASPFFSFRFPAGVAARALSVARIVNEYRGNRNAYLHREHLGPELALLPPSVRLSEGQHVDNQLDRCRAAQPDLVVCGLGLANPLEAEGLTTKWSIELLFTPIQGYDQVGDLASFLRGRCFAALGWRSRPCSLRSGPTRDHPTLEPCASRRRCKACITCCMRRRATPMRICCSP